MLNKRFGRVACEKSARESGRQRYCRKRSKVLRSMRMRLTLTLWMLTALTSITSAAPITCNAGAVSVPVFNPSSVSGAVGDYTLDCTGGTPVLPPNPVPQINITSFMNVSVLNTGGWILTDGVNMTAGIRGPDNVVEFLGVPFNPPGTGHTVFQIENIFVNPSGEAPGFQFRELVEITSSTSTGILDPDQLVAVNATPEPFTLALVGMGLGGMLSLGRSRRAAQRFTNKM